MDAGVQTESEVNIAAMNGYGVVPPVDPKDVYLGPEGQPLFHLVDDHVQEIESKSVKNIQKLVKYLLEVVEQVPKYRSKRELIAVRSFYTWITRNIRYDPGYMEDDLETADILMKKAGVCRHYVKLFTEMCTLADIKNQSIQGFARKTDFKPGDEFDENSEVHAWCGVYIDGSWRLVDPTFGAGSYDHTTGEFTQSQDEFYFLTDPNQLIYSHLPYHPLDSDYHIWQLLAQPISLQQFNALPFLTSEFFQMKLKLLTDVSCPWIIYNNDKIEILSSIVVHYRESYQCENENRSKATFLIQPPIIDSYIFRLFAKPESQIVDEFTRLELICSFLIQADKVLPSIQPWPRNDTAWGFNSEYFKLGCTLVVEDPGKWDGSSIIMTLGSKVSFKFLHRIPLMASAHLYDNKGNEIIEDTKIGTLYIISRKNPLPGSVIQEEAALSRGVHTLVKKKETLFTIISPNNAGFYKMEIYAAKSPKIKGIKMIIPIVASFLVEVRLGQAGDAILQSKSLDALHTFPLKLPPINNIRSKMNNKPSQDDVSLPELNKMAALQPDENFREKEESRRSSIWNPLSLFSAVSSRKPSVAPEHLVNHGRF
ncbi:uncharacterized protein LOC111708442 [Eurytemora carolleeae]|uniref:uncharacterized protein LOC111708442 n=1 Tax=Eurytemora carolleeae TaxID=1294199 RepID=UPI000C76F4D9|nr:uncharacterized protein LOC111708442 [Eurytemora carolleeae]|eukprot:XP_023337588.1 uncharacterized protein LOC111708442 [Eurytemora affinis]